MINSELISEGVLKSIFDNGFNLFYKPSDKEFIESSEPINSLEKKRTIDLDVLKFSKKEYNNSLLNGSILLSSLKYFRKREDQWIGDELENRTVHAIQDYRSRGDFEQDIDHTGPAFKLGLGSFISGVNVIYEATDCYVMCFSTGQYETLSNVMLGVEPDLYDDCVNVSSPERLANAIYKSGRLSDSRRLKDIVSEPVIRMVTYENIIKTGDTSYRPPSPFSKRKQFSSQQELRIAFEFKTTDLPERISVKFRVPKRTLKRI